MAQKKQQQPDPVIVMDTGADILATEIVEISKSAKKLLNSRLEKRAVLVLLKDLSGVSMDKIEKVLAAERLDTLVKKPEKK